MRVGFSPSESGPVSDSTGCAGGAGGNGATFGGGCDAACARTGATAGGAAELDGRGNMTVPISTWAMGPVTSRVGTLAPRAIGDGVGAGTGTGTGTGA